MWKADGIWGRHVPACTALVLALVLAVLGTTTPWPAPVDAPPAAFSAGRAMADVRAIATQPHPAGSAADAAVRGHLAQRLTSLGMVVHAEPFVPDQQRMAQHMPWGGIADRPRELVNLVAVLPGRDRALPAVALMAHHDSVSGSPGAADDGAGLAAIVETVRAIASGPQPMRDLVVILTDGEEIGLDGARQFFRGLPPPYDPQNAQTRDHIGALINLEARGGGGRATLFQTADNNGAAVALAARALHHPAGSSLAVYLYRVLPNDTDVTMALPWMAERGVAAYNFAFIGRPGLYHSPQATADRLDQGSLQDIGGQALDLTRALLTAPALPAPAPDLVFFDLFGFTLVTMPVWAGWIMLACALAAIIAVWHSRGHGRGHVRAALGGAGRMLGLAGLTALLVMGANLVSLHVGGPNYYDRLAATARLEVMATAAALAAFFIVAGRWRPGRAALAGAFVPLWLIALLLQALAPVAAYVVVLPVLLAALIALLPDRAGLRVIAVLIAAPVIGYQLMLGHEMMQAVGSELPLVVTLPLVLITLTVLPLWRPLSGNARRVAVLGCALAALVIALSIRAAPISDTIPPYSRTTRPVS
ncbi:M28 family peptidase [Novosphingobium sp.]|uniref:M28 family peptidase n=1 Tax=Novosphingobium sp. TaxID=1874826 RepID=UPI0033414FBC